MTMTPHMNKKHKRKLKNVKKSAYIQYQLKVKGFSMQSIADELGISNTAVSRAISDLSTITRVDDWLKLNLGIEV